MADIKLRTTIQKEYMCKLSKQELIDLLNRHSSLAHVLPFDTVMTIAIPSGGDYSGVALTLDEVGGLYLRWIETETR
jgi:hypothetical protein